MHNSTKMAIYKVIHGLVDLEIIVSTELGNVEISKIHYGNQCQTLEHPKIP